MMRYLLVSLFLFINIAAFAQAKSELEISFNLLFDDNPLVIAEADNTADRRGAVEVETFKFYLSNLELWNGSELIFTEENSFHLIDAETPNSLVFRLDVPEDIAFSHLRFNVGIDSLTNVSGAFGGDLDPTNGMYWSWQSGYINFKLEGKAENCPARHHRFQFHIGGYQSPFNPLQKIELDIPSAKNISINLAIDKIFQQINIAETYQLMSPNEQSLAFSKLIPSLFSVSK